jgi:hypothetical protein
MDLIYLDQIRIHWRGSCEHGKKKPLNSVKGEKFLDSLDDYGLLKQTCAS